MNLAPSLSTSAPRSPATPSYSLRNWALPWFVGLFCFAIFNANLRQIGTGDSLGARYLPLLLLKYGTLELGDHARLLAAGHPQIPDRDRPAAAEGKVDYNGSAAYWLVRTKDHRLASVYPVVTPVIVAPLYLPAVVWLNLHGWEQPHIDRVAELMEKLSASFLASLACVVMYLVLRRDSGGWCLPLTLAFAFGTNTWMISSQALWQHGAGELFIALALLICRGTPSRLKIVLLGALCALMAANRPPDGLIAAAFAAWTLWTQRSRGLWLLAGAALPVAAVLAYNLGFVGFLAGGYEAVKNPNTAFFRLSLTGVLGLLVSPARGLLIFSSFYLFIVSGLVERIRSSATRSLALALGLAVIAQILVYSQADWRAGHCWGPRWLTDILPILTWLLAPAPRLLGAVNKSLLILAMVVSVAIQAIGAFWYTRLSDHRIFAPAPNPMRAAWNPRNTPFHVELKQERLRGDLQRNASGGVERVDGLTLSDAPDGPVLKAGSVLEGWVRADGAPAEVLLLIDGIAVGTAQDFQPRPAGPAKNQAEPALAWATAVNMRGVPPGLRVLQLAVRIEPRGYLRILREQTVRVASPEMPPDPYTTPGPALEAPELADRAVRAVAQLREHQSSDGYWLTPHTIPPRFEAPKVEMNTFLTSTLVDFVSPVADRFGLDAVVERARTHLIAQIEANGLVRFHGRTDGPTMGKYGYPITPDSDDTALVWRISGRGPDHPQFRSMMDVLSAYRDSRGFYRAWLAPRRDYVNLNPGLDPNPTDIGIQVNICLMLHDLAPAAARDLHDALQRFRDDGDLWVYYSKAPLLPYLRMAELRQRGYDITLPAERLALPVPGQEIWSEVAFQLVESEGQVGNAEASAAIASLLERLSRDDFARIRTTPPLLYHNDMSASVKRYYWSEDFGYVLWLRLFDLSLRIQPGTVASSAL